MATRDLNELDTLLVAADQALRTIFGGTIVARRSSPTETIKDDLTDSADRTRAARLMRVNHTGEVAAQAMYQGQALTARLDDVRDAMTNAAEEENDHLVWCAERIRDLGSHTSLLNPLFYLGSFAIGAAAGIAGDRWSLGFVAETERQVVRHLEGHLEQLPAEDERSRAILTLMKADEERHATTALTAGGTELPEGVRSMMALTARVMTITAYWI